MNYLVWLKSTAGFYEQYDGHVKVRAKNDQEAIKRALLQLRTGAFKDRDDSCWRVTKVERVIT